MQISKTTILLATLSLWVSGGAATPAACVDTCEIGSHGLGYIPPVAEVDSGAAIVWTSMDTFHITADGAPGNPAGTCFFVDHHTSYPSTPVTFDFDGSVVTATVDGVTSECAGAQALPSGAALLQYYCVIHPNMRAALIVNAA